MSRLLAAAVLLLTMITLSVVPVPVSAGSAPVQRDLSQVPADVWWRHSGRQGGEPASEFFGRELATGDFNGDGLQDLAVAADGDSRSEDTSFARGAVYIYFGRGGNWPALIDPAERDADCRISGSSAFAYLGIEMDVGDFNGDGVDDLAVAENELSTVYRGSIFLVSGVSIASDSDIRFDEGEYITRLRGRTSAESGGRYLYFAFSVVAGDFNNDGIDDIAGGAVGGDGRTTERKEAGEVALFLGRPDWPTEIAAQAGTADLFVIGRRAYDHLGVELGAGDVDGDGRPELLAAAWGADGPLGDKPFAGEVSVLSFGAGSPIQLPAQPTAFGITWDLAATPASGRIHGPRINSRLGSSSSDGGGRHIQVGDVDGDGIGDLVVSSPFYGDPSPNGKNPGGVFIVWGDPTLTTGIQVDLAGETSDPTASALLATGTTGDAFGDAIRTNDLNGDGRSEILVGAPDANEAKGYAAIFGARSRPASPQPLVPLASEPDAVVFGELTTWRAGDDLIVLDSTFAGEAMLAIGLPFGGRLPLGGRGNAGEVAAVDLAPLITNLPRVPSIEVQASAVVVPNTSASVPIEVTPGSGSITGVSSPNLPAFARLEAVDASGGLYLLTLNPTAGDRGATSIVIVATDSSGQSASRRVTVNVGYRPTVTAARVKGGGTKLVIDGAGFVNGEAQIVIDGTVVGPVKYQSKFSTDGGTTLNRLTVKSSQLATLIEPGQTSFVTIVNPVDGLSSAPFGVTR